MIDSSNRQISFRRIQALTIAFCCFAWIRDLTALKMTNYGTVGFVGLGIMGKGMLKNLVQKLDPNTRFVVWNR